MFGISRKNDKTGEPVVSEAVSEAVSRTPKKNAVTAEITYELKEGSVFTYVYCAHIRYSDGRTESVVNYGDTKIGAKWGVARKARAKAARYIRTGNSSVYSQHVERLR